MILNYTKTILLTFVLLTIGKLAYGQQEFTLYHMPSLAQSTYLNPAAVPEHKVSISLPILSGGFGGFNNSAINVKALLSTDGTLDFNRFVESLDEKKNYLGAGANAEIFNLRIKAANNFFSLGSRVVADVRFNYPKDLFGLLSEGISGDYSLSGLALNVNSYIEYAAGYTWAKPDSKWTFGGRVKFLHGLANIQTKNTDINVHVNEAVDDIYTYDVDVDAMVNLGLAVDGDKYNSFEDLSDMVIEDIKDPSGWGGLELLNLVDEYKPNKGIAMDLGATFQYTKNLSFGASVLNLGFINWKSFAQNYHIDTQFTVEGVTAEVDFSADMDSLINAQVDSLLQFYGDELSDIDTTYNSYKIGMPTQMFLSANYQITPKFRATGSLFTEFHNGVSFGTVVGANYRFGRSFHLTASWWWFRKSATNLGIGMVIKPGFGQIFVIFDNVLPAHLVKISDPEMGVDNIWLPYQAKNFNVRAGINLVFGKIREESRLPLNGLKKRKDGARRYLFKPALKQ
ncbi:MAG: DUF5723 family protein [Bacteroidota bacterium]